jgi:2-hydroxy-3-oxopropionate reductase
MDDISKKAHPRFNMVTVGYIGLGLMGKPMARHILQAGYPLVVHNRSRKSVNELAGEGAVAASSPAEVAGKVDVLFTNLPDSPDVESVVLGPQGAIQGAHPGLIIVDNSTISPASARHVASELQKVGVPFLDAPVSGGEVGAIQGTLTIMAGGSEETFNQVLPILQTMGQKITYVGESGSGQIAKAANQIMVAAQMVALGEMLLFAQKAGADPRKVVEAARYGSAACWALDTKPERLFSGNRQPGFKSRLQAKDLNIVLQTAREASIPLPSTAINAQLFNAMVALGFGDLDNSAVLSVIEQLAGERLHEDGSV